MNHVTLNFPRRYNINFRGDRIFSRRIAREFCKQAMAFAVVFCCLALPQTQTYAQTTVEVGELTESTWDHFVPTGKEVDAIYGDIVLQNTHLRAVIAKPVPTRNANMTVKKVGGCLIDLTTRAHESDQLSAFYPARRTMTFSEPAEISSPLPSDGSTDSIASVRVFSPGTAAEAELSVVYSLASDARYLTVVSTWKNTTDADVSLKLEDDLRADAGKEEMPKAPNGRADLFWFHDIYWQQAYGIHAPGFQIRSNSNSRDSVLVYEPLDGQSVVVKPGESFSLTRHLFVSQHLPGVRAEFDRFQKNAESLAQLTLRVTASGEPVPNARVTFRDGENEHGTVMTDSRGLVDLSMPQGKWTAAIRVAGREMKEQSLDISSDSTLELALPDYQPGVAKITVTDTDGNAIPVKVQFRGRGETLTPDWGPETAESFVKNLAYAADGQIVTPLAAGQYDLTISRGPEYNAVYTSLVVEPGESAELITKLDRVVETPGWISADFHSHSSPSGDNTSSQRGRVLNLAGEHVEFAPCTEHNRISTYENHISAFKLGPFLATVSGMELTGSPLPLNHQNVFPLIHTPRTQDGGAPTTDSSPETQMERLAAWDNNSVKLIQQNHPDLGWLFFDRDGNQTPDEGYSRSFGIMNVMEIHPIDPLLAPTPFEMVDGKPIRNQTCVNWLQLLNQGYRIYGVVNTDCHYNYHGSGGLRLWLKSTTDDPAKIQSDEMRDVARNGHMIMSNGPYLEASFREAGSNGPSVIAGQDLAVATKKVTGHIRVQCANWLDVDTVFVLVNGRRQPGLEWSRESHPEVFRTDVLKFDQQVEIELQEDAHLIVVTGHRTQIIGDIMGPTWASQHPAAASNPVFIDIDGDGFKANKDTLDSPLPVKFAAPR